MATTAPPSSKTEKYVAKRIRFRNGERLSVLLHAGMPVHIAVLFLNRYRTRGLAANTLHDVCDVLAGLHNHMQRREVDIWEKLSAGHFLSLSDLNAFAEAAQYKKRQLDEVDEAKAKRVVNIEKLRFRATVKAKPRTPVSGGTHAFRLRTARAYLKFVSAYARACLPEEQAAILDAETQEGLEVLQAQVPRVSGRSKLGARKGLTEEQEVLLLKVIDPSSPMNPWSTPFVRARNRMIVITLLAGGMRKGEMLGLKVQDLLAHNAKLQILRRADDPEDSRRIQPNTKTADREVPLGPKICRALEEFIRTERRSIKAARRIPQIFTSDEGDALSLSSANQIFVAIRRACPELPRDLTAHVLRHTWNDRFSEHADKTGMAPVEEERARTDHQGWVDGSPMAATYTRRHTERKGRAVALSIQEKLEKSLDGPS
jgi:integrase